MAMETAMMETTATETMLRLVRRPPPKDLLHLQPMVGTLLRWLVVDILG
jgi:hypothetical protein